MAAMCFRSVGWGKWRTSSLPHRSPRQWARGVLVGSAVGGVLVMAYLAWAGSPASSVKIAEIVSPAGDRVRVDGTPVTTGTPVMRGQQLVTLADTRVGLQQGQQVVARLAPQSSVTVEQACLQLGNGQLLVAGGSGCVGAAIASSAAGIFVLERVGTVATVKVLSGEVRLQVPSNPAVEAIALSANQKVTLSLTGDTVGPVRLMLPTEVSRIQDGQLFQGFQVAIAPPSSPSPSSPSPSPSPSSPSPSTSPQHPIPRDKVPTAQSSAIVAPPAANPPAAPVSTPSQPVPRAEAPRYEAPRYEAPRYETYDPPSDRPVMRRRWTRSPSFRRRPPVYSEPTYREPVQPSAPAPNHPVEPVEPIVPELPTPEVITPIEVPPAEMPPAEMPSGSPADGLPPVSAE